MPLRSATRWCADGSFEIPAIIVSGAGTYPSAAYSAAAAGFTRRGWSGKTSSACTSEANRSSPATSVQNSGFSPARSRARTKRQRQPCHGVRAQALIQRDDGLDVARRAERIPRALAFLAQRGRVVNLAVADHPDRMVGTLERLIAGGQVHDGEAAGAQSGALVADDALAVRAAVRQRGGHRVEAARVSEGSAGERDGAEDAAHLPHPSPTPWRLGGWGGWGGRQGP